MRRAFECADDSRQRVLAPPSDHQLPFAAVISEWCAANPRIRRVCAYEASGGGVGGAREVHVLVDISPVPDSDEVWPAWLAHSGAWRRELQARIPYAVHLGLLGSTANFASESGGTVRRDAGVCVNWYA